MSDIAIPQQSRPPDASPGASQTFQRKHPPPTSCGPIDQMTPQGHPQVPTKRAPPAFAPYKRSLSRGTVHLGMSPLMWMAKHVLTALLRSHGAKQHRYETSQGGISIWEMKGRGPGPVAVVLHGLGGSAAEYFPPLLALRSGCSEVHAIDLPGHGHSDALGSRVDAGFAGVHAADERMVSALMEAVDEHLGDRPAHFIGHSLGGYMAARVVLERRKRGIPSKLLLVETDGAKWSEQRLVQDRSNFSVATFRQARHVARCNYPKRPILGWLYTPFLWARLASAEIQYLTHSDLKQPGLTPDMLNALPADTMVVVGRHDKFGTDEDVAYLMQHLPETARLLRPDTGHGDIADAHPEILAVFDAFLALP